MAKRMVNMRIDEDEVANWDRAREKAGFKDRTAWLRKLANDAARRILHPVKAADETAEPAPEIPVEAPAAGSSASAAVVEEPAPETAYDDGSGSGSAESPSSDGVVERVPLQDENAVEAHRLKHYGDRPYVIGRQLARRDLREQGVVE